LQSEVKLPDVEGTGGIAPHVLHFSSSWKWVVIFTPRSLYTWE
jgi:hypothetical protein